MQNVKLMNTIVIQRATYWQNIKTQTIVVEDVVIGWLDICISFGDNPVYWASCITYVALQKNCIAFAAV